MANKVEPGKSPGVGRRALIEELTTLERMRRLNRPNKQLCATITARLTAIRDELRKLNVAQKARQLNRNLEAACRRAASAEVPAIPIQTPRTQGASVNEEGEESHE